MLCKSGIPDRNRTCIEGLGNKFACLINRAYLKTLQR